MGLSINKLEDDNSSDGGIGAYDALGYVQGGFSILSLLGSFFMITSIITLKRTTKAHGRFLLYLASCQFILSIFYLLSSGLSSLAIEENEGFCKAQGLFIQFFNLASWVWTSCIAGNLWAHIVHGYTNEKVLRAEKYMHIVAWFLPLVSCLVIYSHIGVSDAELKFQWCWISGSKDPYVFFFFYIPLILILALNSVFIAHVVYRVVAEFSENDEVLNAMLSARNSSNVKTFARRIVFYPLVLIVCYFGAFADRIVVFFGREPVYILKVLLTFMSLDGFLTAIVYGVSSSLTKVYKQKWNAWKRSHDGLEFSRSINDSLIF